MDFSLGVWLSLMRRGEWQNDLNSEQEGGTRSKLIFYERKSMQVALIAVGNFSASSICNTFVLIKSRTLDIVLK